MKRFNDAAREEVLAGGLDSAKFWRISQTVLCWEYYAGMEDRDTDHEMDVWFLGSRWAMAARRRVALAERMKREGVK